MNKYNLQVHSDYSSTLIDYYWIPERDSIYESSNAHAINVYVYSQDSSSITVLRYFQFSTNEIFCNLLLPHL